MVFRRKILGKIKKMKDIKLTEEQAITLIHSLDIVGTDEQGTKNLLNRCYNNWDKDGFIIKSKPKGKREPVLIIGKYEQI